MRHPASPFTVRVYEYSLESNRVGMNRLQIYTSRHKSAREAARRLATITTGKSALARDIRTCAHQKGLSMLIECGDGSCLALNPFRAKFLA
jgi:hypothetical protein